jgi:hypothetical protein
MLLVLQTGRGAGLFRARGRWMADCTRPGMALAQRVVNFSVARRIKNLRMDVV